MGFRSLVWLSLFLFACGSEAPRPCPPVAPPVVCPEPVAPATVAPESAPVDERVVVLDGVPEGDTTTRDHVRRYINTRSAWIEAISPDGRRMLVTTRFGETAQVHEVTGPLAYRRQLTFLDEPVAVAKYIPGSDDLLYMSDIGGNENQQVYRLARATGVATRLTDGTSKHDGLVLTRDGSKIAYSGNARNGRDMDIYVADGRDAASARRIIEVSGYFTPAEFSPDGSKLLVYEYVSINDSRYHLLDLATGQMRRITPEQPVAAYRDASFGAGNLLYMASDREGEFNELYEVDISGDATFRPLSRDIPWNVELLAVSADGRTVAFVTNEDGISKLRVLDARSRRARLVPGLPNGVIDGLEIADRAPVVAFSLTSSTRSGDAYAFDFRRNVLTRYTESEIGGLVESNLVEPTLVRYRTFDQREIPALYYRPRGDGPFPVLVYIHGGPEAQSRPVFTPLIQYLAVESGIAVLVPNVRGSDGYGKSYLLLDNGDKREDSVRDIGSLLDWVGQQHELDANRVAVYGGSYGGYMVLASLVHFGSRIRAGIDMVGISSFITFLENTSEYRRDLRRAEYGDERVPAMRELLERISPVAQVGRIESALFVAHGSNDPRVPAAEAEQIVRAVRANGHDVWYMLARNEGHGFQKKENRDQFFELSVQFLERELRRQ